MLSGLDEKGNNGQGQSSSDVTKIRLQQHGERIRIPETEDREPGWEAPRRRGMERMGVSKRHQEGVFYEVASQLDIARKCCEPNPSKLSDLKQRLF